MEASYPDRRVKSNMQRNSTFERHKIGKYMFFSQFANIFLTYQITLQVASTEQKIGKKAEGSLERPCMHVALRMFIMQVLASQLHFLANRNAGLAIASLFWPVNCIKIGAKHVALLGDPTVYSP